MTHAVSPPTTTSEAKADSARTEVVMGAAAIVAFFVLFLGWAALAPLDAGAFADGQFSVSGNRQAVQHQEGGVIRSLHVAEGERVGKGQILITLGAGDLRATERGTAGQVFALLAQRARLIAERDRLAVLQTPAEFAALSNDDRLIAEEAMRLQRRQFAARDAGRSTETGVLAQRIGELEEQARGYERQIEANAEEQRLIADELVGLRSLAAQGYAPQNRVRALERTAANLEGQRGSLRAHVAGTRERIGETRLLMSGVSTGLNEEVADQLRQVEVQLNDLRPHLSELRSQIARSEIRSPATGEIVGLTVFNAGGVIQGGQTLMEVVPDAALQIIVAQIDPADIDNVQIGMSTEVRIPGLRETNPPIIRGRLARVSADTFTDERKARSYFRAEIIVSPEELRKLGPGARRIRSGTPVQVVIKTRSRTALAYLLEPLLQSLWRSGAAQ